MLLDPLEAVTILAVLAAFLTIWVVSGHLIYSLLAGMVRWFRFGTVQRDPGRECPFCGNWSRRAGQSCEWCGHDRQSPQRREIEDIRAFSREVRRLAEKGLIEGADQEKLHRLAQRRRLDMTGSPRGVEPAVVTDSHVRPAGEVPQSQAAPIVAATVVEPPPRPPQPPMHDRDDGSAPQDEPPAGPAIGGGTSERELQRDEPAGLPPSPAGQPPAAPRPTPPRRTLAETLAAFMEERNIHWGEIVGGLLIVCSSVALVVSLWETLDRIPHFQFLIFVVVSSAVFGMGLYAHHRWRLESTSRGLLTIATLLVPLNLLAMAGVSREEWSLLTLWTELVSLGVFLLLVERAGRVLVPKGHWPMVAAVVGNSALLLVLARLSDPAWLAGRMEARSAAWALGGMACVPAFVFAAALAWHLLPLPAREARRSAAADGPTAPPASSAAPAGRFTPADVGATLIALGTGFFAAAVAVGLLVAQARRSLPWEGALDLLALPAAIAAIPFTLAGLSRTRYLQPPVEAAWRTTTTAVALLGAMLAVASVALAWPHPMALAGIGAVNAAVLLFAAFRYRLPAVHGGAIACLGIAYLAAFHGLSHDFSGLARGELHWETLRLAASARSGTALSGFFLALAAAAEVLARRGRRRHGNVFALGAGVAALTGLVLVTFHGYLQGAGDALRAAILYGVYGGGSLALAARWRSSRFAYGGLGLLAAAPLWALWWASPGQVEVYWSTVLAAQAAVGVALGALIAPGTSRQAAHGIPLVRALTVFREPLLQVGEAVALVAAMAAGFAAVQRYFGDVQPVAVWPLATAALLAAIHFALGWLYRTPQRVLGGSILALLGLVYLAALYVPQAFALPWTTGLAIHATAALAAAALIGSGIFGGFMRRATPGESMRELQAVVVGPLGYSGLITSAATLASVAVEGWSQATPSAAVLAWVAALWLAGGVAWREARWFAAGQAVLVAAALAAVTAWLAARDPTFTLRRLFIEPHVAQSYGLALALLSLAWAAARIGVGRPHRDPATIATPSKVDSWRRILRALLDPPWGGVDRIVLHAVVVGHLFLLAFCILPGLRAELAGFVVAPAQTARALAAAGAEGWALWAVSLVALGLSTWDRGRENEPLAGLLLLASLAVLLAVPSVTATETASVLRWSMAAAFGLAAAGLCARRHLARGAAAMGARIETGPSARAAHAVALAVMAAPVLILTVVAVAIQWSGLPMGVPSGWFGRLSADVSYVVPLVAVAAGMVALAVRESSAGYAFSAGLVAKGAVALGYPLVLETYGIRFDFSHAVAWVQALTLAAALWALAWLGTRQWLPAWQDRRPSARALMTLQLVMGLVGIGLLIVSALLMMALFHPHAQALGVEVGSPLGWVAFAAVAAAVGWRQRLLHGWVAADGVGLAGMAAIAMLALSVQRYEPEWGYRALMLGWASYSVCVAATIWWMARALTLPEGLGPSQRLVEMAARWVRLAGLAAVVLGLKAAFLHEQPDEKLYAALAVATASAAGATMAFWQRREAWAFSAALGVNIGASLVVWHFHQDEGLGGWWIRLVQANVIASASVGLVWTAARGRIYRLGRPSLGESPLLGVQNALPMAGLVALLAVAVVGILAWPTDPPRWLAETGGPGGWTALLLTVGGALWYLSAVARRNALDAVGLLAVGAATLVAAMAVDLDGVGDQSAWLAYHFLLLGWPAAGAALLGVGWGWNAAVQAGMGSPWAWVGRLAGREAETTGGREHRKDGIEVASIVAWVGGTTTATLVFALSHSQEDPRGPWTPATAVLLAAVACGLSALWQRAPALVWLSGVSIAVAAALVGLSWQPLSLTAVVLAGVFGLATAAAVWTAVAIALPERIGDDEEEEQLGFAGAAVWTALFALVGIAAVQLVGNLTGGTHEIPPHLAWWAAGLVAVAFAVGLWERRETLAPCGLYAVGLVALTLTWDARGLESRQLAWAAMLELSGFILAAALAGRGVSAGREALRRMRIAAAEAPVAWFSPGQWALVVLAAVLAVWVSIDPAFEKAALSAGGTLALGRWAGPVGLTALFLATVFMAGSIREDPERAVAADFGLDRWPASRMTWQQGAFLSGMLLAATVGFASIDTALPLPWLHRTIAILTAAALATVVCGGLIGGVLPATGGWREAGHRFAPGAGAFSAAALALVLGQEVAHFDPGAATFPLTLPAIAAVLAVLVGMAVACLSAAVAPHRDPLGLSMAGRTAYVYTAEILLALAGLHLRITVPALFGLGFIERYWMVLVMTVAFAGAGLGEWFHRRGLPVLADPLWRTAAVLPLVPAVAFWFVPGANPATWLLMAVGYGVMAYARRSVLFAVLSIAAANLGLWVLWHRLEIAFVEHPQLWLIPPALIVLVAELVNHRRLTSAQSAGIRYMALSVIYVSSTADMFLAGIGESWHLPLVLMLLSVTGILAGIVLRVRAFLYLGATFLMVVLGTMIKYAAVDRARTWVLYVCGIVLGACILAIFALFEKRRNELLAAVERFREWEQ